MTCRPLVLTSLLNQLKALSRRLNELSVEATRVGNAIDEVEEYSHQFNVKIIGLPEKRSETAAKKQVSWKLDKVPLKSTHQTVVCLLMVFLIESESSITYITPKKQNLLFEAERFKEQNQLYRFFWAKNSTSLRKNEGFRPIKIICRLTFLVSTSNFSTLFHFISLFHRGIWYLACEQQTHIRSSLRSLRKLASANPSGKTISVT